MRLACEVRHIHKSRGNFIAPPCLTYSVFQHGREGSAIKREQIFFFAQRAQAACIFRDDSIAHMHFFVELHADLENFTKIFLVVVQHFVQLAIANQNYFYVELHGFRFQRTAAKGIKHFQRLNFQTAMIQCAFQSAPHAGLRKRFQRIHNQKTAVGAQQRSAAQIHEVAGPAAACVVGALNRAE